MGGQVDRQAGRRGQAEGRQAGRQAGWQAGRLAGAGSTFIPICTYIVIYIVRLLTPPLHIGGDNHPTDFSVSGKFWGRAGCKRTVCV